MSVFRHKTQFTSVQLACAIVGANNPNDPEVCLWQQEIELTYPPEYREESVQVYPGTSPIKQRQVNYPAITREQALSWCEKKGIRPPLLFPDDPPAVPVPADNPPTQFKETDLLVTIYRLMLLAKDLDKELNQAAKYSRRRYERGSGISNNAVWEDIEEILNRLGLSTAGLGGSKTRDIFAAACRLGATVSKEES